MLSKGIEHSDVFYMLGEVYRQQAKLEPAIKYLLMALAYQVHSPYVYESLGQCYYQISEYKKSILLLKKFLTMRKSHFANYVIGLGYYKSIIYEEA